MFQNVRQKVAKIATSCPRYGFSPTSFRGFDGHVVKDLVRHIALAFKGVDRLLTGKCQQIDTTIQESTGTYGYHGMQLCKVTIGEDSDLCIERSSQRRHEKQDKVIHLSRLHVLQVHTYFSSRPLSESQVRSCDLWEMTPRLALLARSRIT
jgi:hypothetical protein